MNWQLAGVTLHKNCLRFESEEQVGILMRKMSRGKLTKLMFSPRYENNEWINLF